MTATTSETPASTRKSMAENVKETLESIVVAFILAFVFRAFIVEAFVIPTGSMAPTLYGDNLTNTCSTCGFEYAVGMGMSPRMGPKLRCPNCDTLADEFTLAQIRRPDSGDRILVHKWPLDIGGEFLGPQRWDVTVFKDPRDGTTNFIKRLVGLPGEVLEIIDGDIYTVPVKDLSPELIAAFDKLRLDVYAYRLSPEGQQRSEAAKRDFIKRYHALNDEVLPRLKIQRKLPHVTLAQESLWFNVYSHDFLPNYEHLPAPSASDRIGWRPTDAAAAQAWDAKPREITFKSQSDEPLAVAFGGKPIDDFYAYNNDGAYDRESRLRRLVGDLRLRFIWFPDSGTGGISLRMNRDRDEFVADLQMDGHLRIEGLHPDSNLPGKRQVIGEKKIDPFAAGQAVEVEFINLDYRIALFVNGQEQIASTPAQYAPAVKKLSRFTESSGDEEADPEVKPSRISIAAHNLECRFRHLSLERDVYYRSQKQGEDKGQDPPYDSNPYWMWPGWGTAGCPIMLRPPHEYDEGKQYPGEFLMLGDNSPASKDSRMWWEIGPHLRRLASEYQVGTVPGDQLIGKAFFVYWPAGYRPSWAPGIGLIPNFGQMRWIR